MLLSHPPYLAHLHRHPRPRPFTTTRHLCKWCKQYIKKAFRGGASRTSSSSREKRKKENLRVFPSRDAARQSGSANITVVKKRRKSRKIADVVHFLKWEFSTTTTTPPPPCLQGEALALDFSPASSRSFSSARGFNLWLQPASHGSQLMGRNFGLDFFYALLASLRRCGGGGGCLGLASSLF